MLQHLLPTYCSIWSYGAHFEPRCNDLIHKRKGTARFHASVPAGKEDFAERIIRMAFLRALGKPWVQVAAALGYSVETMHVVKRELPDYMNDWTNYFSGHITAYEQHYERVANQKMAEELEKRNNKALKNLDGLLDSDDENVKTTNTWKVLHQNMGTPKSTVKQEGETQHVVRLVPAVIYERANRRLGDPLLGPATLEIPEGVIDVEETQ